ncbi:NUDIX hydrolase [Candidatus Cyrtobacter comes]|uniref:NUDIX hydrolase n=1 Tax=Candidatus Cyrtobacter comes TaxID=675776 RepID=A0ABU5L6C8_9RICK|nr:NUDIX domain-containing protein [Candidatus Cyrtobacter comes]MDZ5761688.1 NUDIX hydrolase [Candidatus Cyrtobacter comes]
MDSRYQLLKTLSEYTCSSIQEKTNKLLITSFIEQNPDCFYRSCINGHVTGSALLLSHDKRYILLHFHNLCQKWLPFGGHADGESDIASVAMRELAEESGITDVELLYNSPSYINIHYIPHNDKKGEKEHVHYDITYTFICKKAEDCLQSPEALEMRWIPIDILKKYDMHDILAITLKKLELL